MANFFRVASIWMKIAIICSALGLVLFIVGFATNAWTVREFRGRASTTYGLWKYTNCPSGRSCETYSYTNVNDYHRAIQAMECLGLIGFTFALATLLLYFCVDSCRRRDFLQTATVCTVLGLIFACIGFAIFGSKDNINNEKAGEIGWSMGIAIAGAIAEGVAAIMLILQLVR